VNTSKIVSIRPLQGPAPAPPGAAPRPSAVTFRDVMRVLGSAGAGEDVSAPVSFNAESDALMRPLLARYGFERLPATHAELFGLFEYCDSLDAASGLGMRPREELAEWQAASFEVWGRKKPQLLPAMRLFCAGDIDALRALHLEQDTLAALGRDYLRAEE
jgi:hypothetical protein